MEEELQRTEVIGKEGEVYLLVPQKQRFQLNAPGPADKGWEGCKGSCRGRQQQLLESALCCLMMMQAILLPITGLAAQDKLDALHLPEGRTFHLHWVVLVHLRTQRHQSQFEGCLLRGQSWSLQRRLTISSKPEP